MKSTVIKSEEIESIVDKIGPNKVIGVPEEIEGFVQGQTSFITPKTAFNCPYNIFRSMRARNYANSSCAVENNVSKNTKNYLNNHEKKTEMAECSEDKSEHKSEHKYNEGFPVVPGNRIAQFFMLLLDPCLSLSTPEMIKSRLNRFKSEVSANLDNNKSYFKKMGFSRKRSLKVETMKNNIEDSQSDEHITPDILTYYAKIVGIHLWIVDFIEEERIVVNGEKFGDNKNGKNGKHGKNGETIGENDQREEDKVYVYSLDEKDILTMTDEKDAQKWVKQNLEKQNQLTMDLTTLKTRPVSDLRKWAKMIHGEDKTKKTKKDDLITLLTSPL